MRFVYATRFLSHRTILYMRLWYNITYNIILNADTPFSRLRRFRVFNTLGRIRFLKSENHFQNKNTVYSIHTHKHIIIYIYIIFFFCRKTLEPLLNFTCVGIGTKRSEYYGNICACAPLFVVVFAITPSMTTDRL